MEASQERLSGMLGRSGRICREAEDAMICWPPLRHNGKMNLMARHRQHGIEAVFRCNSDEAARQA
jgi:hypothetical protein